jgi:hypothetical protein
MAEDFVLATTVSDAAGALTITLAGVVDGATVARHFHRDEDGELFTWVRGLIDSDTE